MVIIVVTIAENMRSGHRNVLYLFIYLFIVYTVGRQRQQCKKHSCVNSVAYTE